MIALIDYLLYSEFTDGTVGNISSSSAATNSNSNTTTGHTIIIDSNPLNLTTISPGIFTCNTGPYNGRYPSANLHDNGFWNGITYIRKPDDIAKAQPLFTFPNKTGTVTVSYIPALEKCLMVISTASYPGICSMVKEFDIYILESNYIEDS
ncbi:unnamed protein product [Rotaria sordida]|uniref:Uncharacterized protein n=1 Tax=Rotaria sordida TaxID=392033 RepID=A0A814MCX4_9BILA|nr:unnamed protein product [Rotaria sordida]